MSPPAQGQSRTRLSFLSSTPPTATLRSAGLSLPVPIPYLSDGLLHARRIEIRAEDPRPESGQPLHAHRTDTAARPTTSAILPEWSNIERYSNMRVRLRYPAWQKYIAVAA